MPNPAPLCIECGSAAVLTDGRTIYPHREDLHHKPYWRCRCGAYCGCHPGGDQPLGTPAGPETRTARNAAHRVFDPLWRDGAMSRGEAYAWLASELGLDRKRCHIGMMTAAEARRVVAIVRRYREDYERGSAALVADAELPAWPSSDQVIGAMKYTLDAPTPKVQGFDLARLSDAANDTPIGAKAEHVRAALRRGDGGKHHCHWPNCDQTVPPAAWGCRPHWFKLPKEIRDRIWRAFRPGQEDTKTPSRAYIEAAREAQAWIEQHG
jgi:hypothetical protein